MSRNPMTSRERLWAALSRQEPDRVPIWMLYPRERYGSYADVDHLPSYAPLMPLIREHTGWFDRRDLPHPPFYTAAARIETHTTREGRYTIHRHALHTPYGDLTMERWRDGQNEPGAVVKYYVETVDGLEWVLALPSEPAELDLHAYHQAGPYAAELTPRQQANTARMIEAGLKWGKYPLAVGL
jgi:hypothetical protein